MARLPDYEGRKPQDISFSIAQAITKGTFDGVKHDSRAFDETKELYSWHPETISNEFSLYELFPYIREKSGSIVGVGMDTMLDIFVNTQASSTFIVDASKYTSRATRAILETGRRLKIVLGRQVEPEELIDRFKEENILQTVDFIKSEFTFEEAESLKTHLAAYFPKDRSAPPAIHTALEYKRTQPYYTSWLSSPAALDKVLTAYDNHQISVVTGDVTSREEDSAFAKISSYLDANDQRVSLLYLSNVEDIFAKPSAKMEDLDANIASLPSKDLSILSTMPTGISIVPPSLVMHHPYLSRVMVPWTYCIQSPADRENQKAGIYGREGIWGWADNTTINERIESVRHSKIEPADIGLHIPKPGIVLAFG